MSVSDQINRVKYIAEDFATYRAEADEFFQTYYPDQFNNTIATDLGNALMDQLAFAMQALSFMTNRKASELFLATARLNKSIVKLARMLGYPIRPASPSSCDLTIQLPKGPYAFPITIPIGFQWQGPGDTIYEYYGAIPYVIAPGITTVTIPIKEGSTRSLSFISDGTEGQQFSIFGIPSGQYLYNDEMIVTVDGSAWNRLDLITYESLNIYEILFADIPPKMRFGDGIAGNVPALDSQIVLNFRYGKGASGAIGKDQIKGPVIPIVVNGVQIPVKTTNSVANVGENPEDIRHVQAFASTFFRTQNAAVIKADYDSIASLQSGVALADTQIIRGINNDITIQWYLAQLGLGQGLLEAAVAGIQAASVTGTGSLGVSGIGTLGVSGSGALFVSGTGSLGVSGTQFLGCDVSGNVTGVGLLGVSGLGVLTVGGKPTLGVSGIGTLGVSGIDALGISSYATIVANATSGFSAVSGAADGLSGYLSQIMSDTSVANHVQVILLSSDSNNKYIAPSNATITNVKAKLDSLKDAVVTINVVSGVPKIIECDVEVEMGISQTAVASDVEALSLNAMIGTSEPFGLLVRRSAGVSLYVSDIENAIRSANATGDLRYINVKITAPLDKIDAAGNLIISSQQIIQNRDVTVNAAKRFLINGEVVTI